MKNVKGLRFLKNKLMKCIIVFSLSFFLLLDCYASQMRAQVIDTLARKDIKELNVLVNDLKNIITKNNTDSAVRKDIQNLQIEITSSRNLSQIADSLISWSALILAVFSIFLVAAGFYTTIRVNEIKKIKMELETLQSDSEFALKENKKAIDALNEDFENQKNIQLKLTFPLIKCENSFLQGDYYNAAYHYNEAKAIANNHPWLINSMWLLINSRRFEEAIRYLTGQLELDSNNNDVKYYLAHVYRRQGLLEKAEKLIEPIATEKKHALSIYEYATILFLKGEFRKAENVYKDAINNYLLPDLFVHLNLAFTQIINKNQKEATINSNKAIELIKKELIKTPNNPHLILQLGVAKLLKNENGIENIKSSIKKGLQSENAKSAIDKIKKVADPNPEMLEAIKILQKYYDAL